jgi:hypothetical protein
MRSAERSTGVCALLERDSETTRQGARRALEELAYDRSRIEALILLGEPTAQGARQRRQIIVQSRWAAWTGADVVDPERGAHAVDSG